MAVVQLHFTVIRKKMSTAIGLVFTASNIDTEFMLGRPTSILMFRNNNDLTLIRENHKIISFFFFPVVGLYTHNDQFPCFLSFWSNNACLFNKLCIRCSWSTTVENALHKLKQHFLYIRKVNKIFSLVNIICNMVSLQTTYVTYLAIQVEMAWAKHTEMRITWPKT